MAQLILKPGKQKSLLRFHPWIFSGAIEKVVGKPVLGETVEVLDSGLQFICWAAYSPESQIRARVWSWDQTEKIDEAFLKSRIRNSIMRRTGLQSINGAIRLVFGESDGLPGLIVDQYNKLLAVQILSAGPEYWRDTLVRILCELIPAETIYERSDIEARRQEGLSDRSGLLAGLAPTSPIEFQENGILFEVDVIHGQKTGFFLDQRINRSILNSMAANAEALDCFCYSGGFTVNLLRGGAKSVISVDSSANALTMAQHHVEINNLNSAQVDWQEKDVFQYLRELRDRNKKFDLIILDPPKFAQHAGQVEKAARAYKDINLLALKLLRPGGILATFSCSGSVDQSLFQKIIAGAAADARVNAQIFQYMYQSPDHPILLSYPEAAYLKGFLIRV